MDAGSSERKVSLGSQDGLPVASGWLGDPTIQDGLQIGTIGWTTGAMNGLIGEVALYDKALSAQRVRAHYSAGL